VSQSKRANKKHMKGPAQARPPISHLNIEKIGTPRENPNEPNSPANAKIIKSALNNLSQKELSLFFLFDTPTPPLLLW